MNKNVLIGAGVFLAVVLVGFYSLTKIKPPNSSKNVAVQGAPIKEFSISAKEYGFTPSTITANKGDNVKINFTNNGTTGHNFTISDLGVATKTVSPGGNDSITFNVPNSGTFTFYCSVDSHRDLGMQGNLEVK